VGRFGSKYQPQYESGQRVKDVSWNNRRIRLVPNHKNGEPDYAPIPAGVLKRCVEEPTKPTLTRNCTFAT
jgi:hypothetical protein